MRVLVTGAGGFLGLHLVDALNAAGHSVRAQVRSAAAAEGLLANRAGVDVVVADLLVSAELRAMCTGVDAIVHLAAAMRGTARQMHDVACRGTQRLLDAMVDGSTRLLLVSSFAVYDWQRVGPVVDEASPLLADDRFAVAGKYAAAKTAQENLTRQVCERRGIGLTVLRPATVWGAGHWGIDTVGPRIAGTQWVVSPRRRLQLTYVENCTSAFVAALVPAAVGQTFNIEDGHGVDAAGYAAAIVPGARRRNMPAAALRLAQTLGLPFAVAARAGWRVPGLLIPARLQARFAVASVAASRLRTNLHWQPPYDFNQALARATTART